MFFYDYLIYFYFNFFNKNIFFNYFFDLFPLGILEINDISFNLLEQYKNNSIIYFSF